MKNYYYHIVRLIKGYFAETLDNNQYEELKRWVDSSPENKDLWERIVSGSGVFEREELFRQLNMKKALAGFDKKIGYHRDRRISALWISVAAAVALILIVSGAFFYWHSPKEDVISVVQEIEPGSYRATLMLETGERFYLERDSSKLIHLNQGIVQKTGEELVYITDMSDSGSFEFNTIETPRGGEFSVILSDGTKIWLNAATKLKYPVNFDSKKREVYLDGEAYFEVAHNSDVPFYVVTDGIIVKVLGTSFNIKTHYNDRIETVLVEGSIDVRGELSSNQVVMKPGQLSTYSKTGKFIDLRDVVDTLPYIAWRSGRFIFEEETLDNIMSTLSRWYDVDIIYTDTTIKAHRFTGHMRKYDDINKILEAIGGIVKVDFKIDGEKIIIFNKK